MIVFSKLIYRHFNNEKHLKNIGSKLTKIPFVRLGIMCDPSSDWKHTFKIIDMSVFASDEDPITYSKTGFGTGLNV